MAVTIVVAAAWGQWGWKMLTTPLHRDVLLGVGLGLIALGARGLSTGQAHRSVDYLKAETDNARCGNALIIRTLGNHYLAVLPNNARVLVDADCKSKFVLIPSGRFKKLPEGSIGSIALGLR